MNHGEGSDSDNSIAKYQQQNFGLYWYLTCRKCLKRLGPHESTANTYCSTYITDYMAYLFYTINIKYYLKNDLYGEESSKDMVCIAQDLKTQQRASWFSV